jgi:formylmethanofuran dehydrogenase subunit E
MPDLETLLRESASRHHSYLCPRPVLGVRMGLHAAELQRAELPRVDKRLFVFVETDGCRTDGVVAATGCWWGRRTMYLMD